MGQNDALAIAWGALFRNGAGAYTKCTIGINMAAHKPQHISLSSWAVLLLLVLMMMGAAAADDDG